MLRKTKTQYDLSKINKNNNNESLIGQNKTKLLKNKLISYVNTNRNQVIETNNIYDISGLFEECCNLESIPDISQWTTINFMKIEALFFNCKRLSYIFLKISFLFLVLLILPHQSYMNMNLF